MYAQLLVKHFENSVPKVVHLPIPRRLRHIVAAILILHNPDFPRHFLNGCYFILQDIEVLPSNLKYHCDRLDNLSLSLKEALLSLVQCPDSHWHQLQTWNSPLFSQYLPLVLTSRFLVWPQNPNVIGYPPLSSEGASLVLSMKPSSAQKTFAAIQCYITQVSSNSWIVDGEGYFSKNYPAKSFLVKNETTLAWIFGETDNPVGFIQFVSLENNRGETHILITGLSIEDPYRRRGFGRGLICAVVSRSWHCKEFWVAVQAENQPAASLYFQCGFVVRKSHWNFSMNTVVPKK